MTLEHAMGDLVAELSVAAAERSAVVLSIIETCKLCGVDADVSERRPWRQGFYVAMNLNIKGWRRILDLDNPTTACCCRS